MEAVRRARQGFRGEGVDVGDRSSALKRAAEGSAPAVVDGHPPGLLLDERLQMAVTEVGRGKPGVMLGAASQRAEHSLLT